MRIALASDHAGVRYKGLVAEWLTERGYAIRDFGTGSEQAVDYPDFIRPAAEAVARGECDRGIVFGGSGIGEAIAANRVRGVRCAICWNAETARLSRAHNDANMLSLGQRVLSEVQVLEILAVWLTTAFDEGRHRRRIDKLDA